jgi:Na+/H+ antiporter NhaA
VAPGPLLLALGILSGIMLLRLARIRYGLLYFLLGAAAWVALQASGVEPVVLGLALGLLTSAYASARADLERATDLFRLFREQPTPELVESARVGPAQSLSPNERLQRAFHPWTSPVIVPHFALANASVEVSKEFLGRAATSPITLGIVAGYVLGKPIGILGTAWLVSRLSRGRLRISIGWGALAGTGAIAGIGRPPRRVLAHARPAATASTGIAPGSPGALRRRPRAGRRPVPRGCAPPRRRRPCGR